MKNGGITRGTAVFAVTFFATYGALAAVGLVPEGERALAQQQAGQQEDSGVPVRIAIPDASVDAPIENPTSRDIATLDAALQDGVVHYPGSGDLTEERNVFLFGHSSSLPVVHNQMYKVFSDLRDLEPGDEITVYTETHAHVYRVRDVSLADADEALVTFETGEKELTLSTCNTFGEKSERYVVNAAFVESSPRSAE